MGIKYKKCKGIGKAKGFEGCGQLAEWRKYGLCKRCFAHWLYNTPEGKETLNRSVLKGKKRAEQKAAKEQRKLTKEQRDSLRPKSYWENKLQVIVNRMVRKVDQGQACISSGRALGDKYDAGHFFSVGANASLRFNLLNIYAQSVEHNQYKGGSPIEYAQNLINLFGNDVYEEIMSLKREYPVIKLSIPELKECIERAKGAEKWLNTMMDDVIGIKGRISQRNRIYIRRIINEKIGIY